MGVGSGGRVGGVKVDVDGELKFLGKFTRKNSGGVRRGVRWGGRVDGGVRVDVNEQLKFFVKIQKKKWGSGSGGGGWVGGRVGGQVGCERRVEVFGIIHKKKIRGVGKGGSGGGGWSGCRGGVRVDVNEELKFL